ncbi:MAG: helix-turn-helix transcriptional regulator [Rhodoblastus sp.]|uniref:helix-turn-helix transcriptional regulator n=1 Tax=Rhodoblastus sp. TaxID=1962975 RepID=UPI003F9E572E
MANEFSDEALAKQIRTVLKQKRVSMKTVAEKMDISYRTVQNYVSGENRITAEFILRLSHLLQIDPGYFVYGDFRPNYHALRDAVIDALAEAGLIPNVSHRSEPAEREQISEIIHMVTSEIATKYDQFRREDAFGPYLASLPFGDRERKRS